MKQVQTVSGAVKPEALGKTLMHEHLTFGVPGWSHDPEPHGALLREMVEICVDRVEELKASGFRSLLDPCPNDMGRSVELMGEVAVRTGFNIICATGLYHETWGSNAYWRALQEFGEDCVQPIADIFLKEITEGVGPGKIRAGIIKVGTTSPEVSRFETAVLGAAAVASNETGVPITTHTDAVLGDVQVEILTGNGVPASRIIVGHCCGSVDHAYHMRIAEQGAYIGFDRFGALVFQSDEARVDSLMKLHAKDRLDQVIISHDTVWCMQKFPLPREFMEKLAETNYPLRFSRYVTPLLLERGMTEAQIDALLVENPRRFFADLPASAH